MVPAETGRSREARGLSKRERRRDSSRIPTASKVDARGVMRLPARVAHPSARKAKPSGPSQAQSAEALVFDFRTFFSDCRAVRERTKKSKSAVSRLDFVQRLTTAQMRAGRHRRRAKAAKRLVAAFRDTRLRFFFPKRPHEARAFRDRLVSASEARNRRRARRERVASRISFAARRPVIPRPQPDRGAARRHSARSGSRPDRARRSRTQHEHDGSPRRSRARVPTRDARAPALVPRGDDVGARGARARYRRARVRRRVRRGEPARGGPRPGGPPRLALGGGRRAGHAGRAVGRPAGKHRDRRPGRAPRRGRRGVRGDGVCGAVPASGASFLSPSRGREKQKHLRG